MFSCGAFAGFLESHEDSVACAVDSASAKMRVLLVTYSIFLLPVLALCQLPSGCRNSTATENATDVPRSFGFLLFRAIDPLDVMGPNEVLFTMGRFYQINVALISETLDLVTSEPQSASMNKHNSSTWTQIQPTHTFGTAPDLDVLIVPGGAGTRSPALNSTIEFIRTTFPKVKYFMTVCTGAMLAAKAGVLDGRNATTNKQAWLTVINTGPKTNWIGDARYVVDGKIADLPSDLRVRKHR